jgi:hypothetical protein
LNFELGIEEEVLKVFPFAVSYKKDISAVNLPKISML